MAKKNQSLKRISKRIGVDPDKLDDYMLFLNDELLFEPDYERPGAPCLTAEQRDMYNKYSFAFAQASMGRPDSMILSSIEKQFGVKEGMARIILKEAYYLFGDGEAVSKKGKTRAAILYLEMLSNLARAERDYKTAKECWVEAKKLEGLYDIEGAGWNPSDFRTAPQMVILTGDVAVLKQQQREDDE